MASARTRTAPPAQDGDLDGNSPAGKAYVQRVLERLRTVATRRSTYLQVARCARDRAGRPMLLPSEYYVLMALAERARADLTSSFPSARVIADQEHFSERHVKRMMSALVIKGWLARLIQHDSQHGGLAPSFNQFCIPAGAIKPWAVAWSGPLTKPTKSSRG